MPFFWIRNKETKTINIGEEKMKISYIKNKTDNNNFEFIKSFGGKVYEIEDPENIDLLMNKLYREEHCKTIVISNELASFSEDIIKKYNTNTEVKIIIAPSKNK